MSNPFCPHRPFAGRDRRGGPRRTDCMLLAAVVRAVGGSAMTAAVPEPAGGALAATATVVVLWRFLRRRPTP